MKESRRIAVFNFKMSKIINYPWEFDIIITFLKEKEKGKKCKKIFEIVK